MAERTPAEVRDAVAQTVLPPDYVLAAIVESADDAIVGMDLKGLIASWNPGAERLYGYTATEAVGRPVSLLVPLERAGELATILERLRRGERIEHYETVLVRKDGRRIDVSVSIAPIWSDTGGIAGIVSIGRDITERKRAESRIRGLLEAAPDAIVTVDAAGRIVLVNAQTERLFGYTRQELLGQPVEVLLPEHARQAHERHRAGYNTDPRARPMGVGLNLSGRRRDGSEFPAEISLSPFQLEEGGALVIAAVRDVTERRQAEEARARLIEEQAARAHAEAAVQARDTFLAVAAHELKTPLTGLLAAVQLTLRLLHAGRAPDVAAIAQRLRTAERQATKLDRLVTQLLDVSRLETGKLRLDVEETDLAALVREVVAIAQAHTTRHHLRVRAARLTVCADPLRLEQVLANLLDNAIKFSPHGRSIEVAVSAPVPGRARVTVRDHGIGIPVDRRALIFDPYYQAHAEEHRSGLGLGLYISRRIVELHGGTIAAEFPRSGGTRFSVDLPAGTSSASSEA